MGRFEQAAETFPVLKFVLEEYFGSPEHEPSDAVFIDRYEEVGETSAEFRGLTAELDLAMNKYALATFLVNGVMGTTFENSEVRTQLASLRDQLTHEGDFSPTAETADDDPFKVDSAQERIQRSFMWERTLPFGLMKGRKFPMLYLLAAGVALILAGLGITYIPFISQLGLLLIVLGGVVVVIMAVGILSLAKEYNSPDDDAEREEIKREIAEGKKKRGGKGLFKRMNPFV